MNLLVISSLYPSLNNPLSGIFVRSQVQGLVKGGVKARVLAPVPLAPFPLPLFSKRWKGFRASPQYDVVDGIAVHYPRYLSLPRNWLFERSGEWMYRGMRELVSEIANEFPLDLIHAHVALPAGYAAMRAAEDLKVPFVVTIHGGDLQRTIHLNQACKKAIGKVINNSMAVILVSNKLKRIAEEQFDAGSRFKVIPNGIDPDYMNQFSYRQNVAGSSHKTILSVSNLFPTKGIDLNLQAVQRLVEHHPDLKYQIIGSGPEQGYLKHLVKELDISNQVEFLGQLPHDQVMNLMAECDIFSLPSWQEGFGIVYLEAMAHGKPVIGCQGEGIEDFVVDGETGYLVKPKDVDDLVRVLDDLLAHPHLGTQTGKAARNHVLENYTWESNAHRTLDLYREIIRMAKGKAPGAV